MKKINFVGDLDTSLIDHGIDKEVTHTLALKPKYAFNLSATRDGGNDQSLEVSADDLMLLQMEDGTEVWTRVDQFEKDFPQTSDRGGHGQSLTIPRQLRIGHPSRGLSDWAIKALRIFDLDPSKKAAHFIGALAEKKLKKPGSHFGLYRCVSSNQAKTKESALELEALNDAELDGRTPILIFIHGTFSNTIGSFGELWSPSKSSVLTQLRKQFGNNIFALEHKTLTANPVDNALDLARALDKLTDSSKLETPLKLHFVTHSRGGLVGELFSRVDTEDENDDSKIENTPFKERELKHYTRVATKNAQQAEQPLRKNIIQAYELQVKKLSELSDLLDRRIKRNPDNSLNGQRRFTVSRFVRVACPARGTSLASGRLDRWASTILNVIGKIPILKVSGVYDGFQAFALAIIKQRTDPLGIPGLEAQMPTAPLIQMLNLTPTRVKADLSVISGDVEANSFWGKLKLLIPDLYYRHEHDLVVDTMSMAGGTQRTGARARYLFDQGPEVNHFQYFKNDKTARAMLAGLAPKDDEDLFIPLSQQSKLLRSKAKSVDGKSPIVYVLPGIMGSHIQVGHNRVWLDLLWDIPMGGMEKLKIDAENVSAEAVMQTSYGHLLEHLRSENHDAVPFAFDWRLSLETEAERFVVDLDAKLKLAELNNQTVHIIAHSMGGLLARTAFSLQPALWDRLVASGGRLLMLGTPNKGAHVIARTLLGREKTVKMLAAVDIKHSQKSLLKIIAQFPGVLSLLPDRHGSTDLLEFAQWNNFKQVDGKGWVLPQAQNLKNVKNFWASITGFNLDHPRIMYVAGKAPATAEDVEIRDLSGGKKEIYISGTAQGDGRVTWASGIPANVSTWYLNASHGKLAAVRAAFPAYLEILQTGETQQSILSREKVTTRGEPASSFRMPEQDTMQVLPDQRILLDEIMGSNYTHPKTDTVKPIKIKISHGDLLYADNPIAIGHYHDDMIISAERYLDEKFDHRLRMRMNMGLYPGAINTAELITNTRKVPHNKPTAVLVIGLGTMGKLTQQKLAQAYRYASVKYALETMEQSATTEDSSNHDLKLSSLLVGTGIGGISVVDALLAMTQGVAQANEQLSTIKLNENLCKARFVELEFIEYWQDVANAAAHAISDVNAAMGSKITYQQAISHGRKRANPSAQVTAKTGGRTRNTITETAGWWRRLQIQHIEKDGSLKFNALTDQARTEISLQAVDVDQVDKLVEKSISSPYYDDDISKTLFEMLIPYDLKTQSANQKDTVLVLNEKAARYPWELLEDRWAVSRNGRQDGSGNLPIAIQHSFIRQLESTQYRANASLANSQNALIIGNPRGKESEFTNLPGAEREAKSVNALLTSGAYQSTFYLGEDSSKDAQEVIKRLHKHAYRIIHFAGHGVYEHDTHAESKACDVCGQSVTVPKKVTGMVIGDNAFLTPANIESIRFVPELVFINCCHLGREEGHQSLENGHKLAANLATEFIRMGVKAIVATGWAVDDRAAETFANTFYRQMLNGSKFGAAVLQARRDTYQLGDQTNTWGAYQCYGNPDFQLVTGRDSGAVQIEESVSPAELLFRIENICMDAKTMCHSESDLEELKQKLDRNESNIPAEWRNSAINQALGRAYAELGAFESAIQYYATSVNSEEADVSLKSIEQLANLKVKYARQLYIQTKQDKTPLKLIHSAITTLKELNNLGETSERQSLLGSAYKRKASILVTYPEQCDLALHKMHDYYARASELAKGKSYPLYNAMATEAVLDWRENKNGFSNQKTLNNKIKELIVVATGTENPMNFWHLCEQADLKLLRYFVFYKEKNDAKSDAFVDIEEVAEDYLSAVNYAGSPKESSSIIEHIEFLADMLRPLGANSRGQSEATLKHRTNMSEALTRDLISALKKH